MKVHIGNIIIFQRFNSILIKQESECSINVLLTHIKKGNKANVEANKKANIMGLASFSVIFKGEQMQCAIKISNNNNRFELLIAMNKS
jgi:hypothetical protein